MYELPCEIDLIAQLCADIWYFNLNAKIFT